MSDSPTPRPWIINRAYSIGSPGARFDEAPTRDDAIRKANECWLAAIMGGAPYARYTVFCPRGSKVATFTFEEAPR